MKKIIVELATDWSIEKQNSMIQAALNQGFTNFLATGEICDKLAEIERIKLYTPDQDRTNSILLVESSEETQIQEALQNTREFGVKCPISSKEDEKYALSLAKQGVSLLICKATDWKIIPFENLIANLNQADVELIADIGSTLSDAEILLHTLERGVNGILFCPNSENDLIDLKKLLQETLVIPLETATVEKVTPIPEADRVCVDTSSMLHAGEGMLVGNTSKGFALVHAEVFESEFVNSRPFRVNAGDVSDYIIVPQYEEDGTIKTRTNYLSELKAGDRVVIVNTEGATRIVSVGRVKIETRPMLLFELTVHREEITIPLLATIQNAETVRLVRPSGEAVSGTVLQPGDEILVYVGPGATHFGTAIKETIIEK